MDPGDVLAPPATGPPTPSRKGGSIFASAPPRGSSTTPVRTCTMRIPSFCAARSLRLPCHAHLREEVAPGRRLLVEWLFAVGAVVADRRTAHQHRWSPGRGRTRAQPLHQVARPDRAALADCPLGARAPALRDILAGEMHHRVATFERPHGRRPAQRVPASTAGTPAAAVARSRVAREHGDLRAILHQRRDERAPDQAGRAGERHPHRLTPRRASRWGRRPGRSRPPGRPAPCR